MKYKVINHKDNTKKELITLEDAKLYVSKKYPEYVLASEKEKQTDGYRCMYSWGGYMEGLQIYISETEE